jgi:peptidoglycan/LPS O-acetylase OafA/YrhL
MTIQTSQRRFELDWLRVLAILSVFVYHTTRFFNRGEWHLKNPTTYLLVDAIELVMEVWLMPVIFVISGMSLFYAMGKGGFGRFFKR